VRNDWVESCWHSLAFHKLVEDLLRDEKGKARWGESGTVLGKKGTPEPAIRFTREGAELPFHQRAGKRAGSRT